MYKILLAKVKEYPLESFIIVLGTPAAFLGFFGILEAQYVSSAILASIVALLILMVS